MKTYIDTIVFKNPLATNFNEVFGMISSDHSYDCCEWHELDFDNSEKEFELVQETLSKIDKMEIYGEKDMGVTFFFYDGEIRVGIFVPGRGDNNGYYSDELTLNIKTPDNGNFTYDITEYQDYQDY